jgi:TRAP transporter TAXI family solute receptor
MKGMCLKASATLFALVVSCVPFSQSGWAQDGTVKTISWSLGGTTGMYYRAFAPVSNYINSQSKTLRVIPTISSGSTENAANLINRSSQIGCLYPEDAVEAYSEDKSMRYLGPAIKTMPLQFVVLKTSDIKKIADLEGRVISYGAPGTGSRRWMDAFMGHIGLADKVTEVPMGTEEQPNAMKDGDIEMLATAAFPPVARIEEIAVTNPIRILDVSEYLDSFLKAYPVYLAVPIPAGSYNGHDVDVMSFGLATANVATADVPDDVIAEFMKWTYSKEGQEQALSGQKQGPNLDAEDPFADMVVPIHPAAKAFWESKGYTVPDLKTQ